MPSLSGLQYNFGSIRKMDDRGSVIESYPGVPGSHGYDTGSNVAAVRFSGFLNANTVAELNKLASKLEALKSSTEVEILDMTDIYQAWWFIGKIRNLELAVEARGFWHVITFTGTMDVLQAWGTIYIQTDGMYSSDLMFKEKRSIHDPTMGKCNITHSTSGYYRTFTHERILENDIEETGTVSVIFEDDQNSFWDTTTNCKIRDVTYPLKSGNNCLEIRATSTSFDIHKTWGTGQDWSGYDYFVFWFYGMKTGHQLNLKLFCGGTADYRQYDFLDVWSGWRKVSFPLSDLSTWSGTPPIDISDVQRIQLESGSCAAGDIWYVDRGVIDVGSWAKYEFGVPDRLRERDEGINHPHWKLRSFNPEADCMLHAPLDEGVGTEVYDISPLCKYNGFGIITNGSWKYDADKGWCLDFDGSSTKVTFTTSDATNLAGPVSVAAWVKLDSYNTAGYDEFFNRATCFNLLLNNGKPQFSIYYSGGWNDVTMADTITTGAWYRIVATNDGTNTRIYLNGALKKTGSCGSPDGSATGNPIVGFLSAGREPDGLIKDARVWLRTLSATEVEDDYAGEQVGKYPIAVDDASLHCVLHLPLDEFVADVNDKFRDLSGYSNHAKLISGVAGSSIPGRVGRGAIDFDGSSDYLQIAHDSSLDVTSEKSTLAYWVKIDTLGDADVHVCKGLYQTDGWYIEQKTSGPTNGFRFVSNQSAANQDAITNNNVLGTNEWTHVAVVRDGSDVRIYVNGVDETSGTPNITDPLTTGRDLYIGRYDAPGREVDGKFDEVMLFFDKAFTAAEVQELYEHGRGFYALDGSRLEADQGYIVGKKGSGRGLPHIVKLYEKLACGDTSLVDFADIDNDADPNTFWSETGVTDANDTATVVDGERSLKVTLSTASQHDGIYHLYGSAQDWSGYDAIAFYFYGNNSGDDWKVLLTESTTSDTAEGSSGTLDYSFGDNVSGWRFIIIPIKEMSESNNPDLAAMRKIIIRDSSVSPTDGDYYVDGVRFLKGAYGIGYVGDLPYCDSGCGGFAVGSLYGSKRRLCFGAKMPPATKSMKVIPEQIHSARNKIQLRLDFEYNDRRTSYIGYEQRLSYSG